jgi:hypothetical protein
VFLLAGLLALAVAQPVVARVQFGQARKDAEALVVVDISRSMLASRSPTGTTRIDRARAIAKEFRARLPGVPVGVASLTDRVLPHLFPTSNEDVFLATVDRALGIERPPPDRTGRGRATSLGALGLVGTRSFFTPGTTKRVAVVLTDGESLPVNTGTLAGRLAEGGVTPLIVHVWGVDERIFDDRGKPLATYFADPDAPGTLESIANAIGSRVFAEADADGVARAARAVLGDGPMGKSGAELESLELAPYAVLASFVPLLFLVWRRNLAG